MGSHSSPNGLACCHGYRVVAGELDVGHVETPIFSGALSEPEFLLVRTSSAISGTFKIVPTGVVVVVEPDGRRLEIAVDAAAVDALPERLPLTRFATSELIR